MAHEPAYHLHYCLTRGLSCRVGMTKHALILDSIKKQRGESVDDGTATAPLKPLVEVLREAKEQKEASFAA
ncbi:Nefa_Nip30_N domain-containing protein, partial [Haematococcus lacustris]